jgi:hypothetical protein
MLPHKKLDAEVAANMPLHFFQFLGSLLRCGSDRSANHALPQTAAAPSLLPSARPVAASLSWVVRPIPSWRSAALDARLRHVGN